MFYYKQIEEMPLDVSESASGTPQAWARLVRGSRCGALLLLSMVAEGHGGIHFWHS